MIGKVILSPEGDGAALFIRGLDDEGFKVYREAVAGGRYDRTRKATIVSDLGRLATSVRRLRQANIAVVGDRNVLERLTKFEADRWIDLKSAQERIAEVEAELRTRGHKLRPYQVPGIEWLATRFAGLLADDPGTGKLQPIDAIVLTPTGPRPIGDLRVGDRVIGSSGEAVAVTRVSPQGVKPVYRVSFNDGSSTEAGDEHLWALDYYRGGRTLERVVVTTAQLRMGETIERRWPPNKSHRASTRLNLARTRLYLPMLSGPIEYEPSEPLPLDPYVLGQIIANAYVAGTSATLTTNADDWEDVRRSIEEAGVRYGSVQQAPGCVKVNLIDGVIGIVRALGVAVHSGEKRVPKRYLLASVDDRLALLQGLMDGDGSVSAVRNRVTYSTTSEGLARDVRRLVEELGGISTVRTYDRSHQSKPIEHQVRVKMAFGLLPFRVRRKLRRYDPECRQPARGLDAIEYSRDVESVCIAIDAPDRLYATEHAILTHNSAQLLLAAPAGAPMLAVVPAAARAVWERLEPAKWRPSVEVRPLNGRGSFAWPEPGQLVVTNYDILPRLHVDGCPRKTPAECSGCVPDVPGGHYPHCTKTKAPTICPGCSGEVPPCPLGVYAVFDEAHAAKNPKSLRGEATAALAALVLARAGRVFPATGTPLLNRPQELWDVLKVFGLSGEAFSSYSEFARMMGGEPNKVMIYDRQQKAKVEQIKGWKFPTNPEDLGLSPEVADRLQRVMLRRRVEEVAQDLPKKSRRILSVDVGPAAIQKCDRFLEALGGSSASAASLEKLIEGSRDGLPFEMWTKIRAALASAKFKASLDVVSEYEEQGEPVVFFSMFKGPVEKMGDREGWETITGGTSKKERGRIVDAFQAGLLKGLAGTVGAIGVAVTLTRARFVVFNDRDVSPAINRQAEDRVSRIGQKRPVLVTVLAANHPLDVRIEEILERKTRLIEGSVDAAADRGGKDPAECGEVVESTTERSKSASPREACVKP